MRVIVDQYGLVTLTEIDLRSIYFVDNIDNVIENKRGILIADILEDKNFKEFEGVRSCSEACRFPDKITSIIN